MGPLEPVTGYLYLTYNIDVFLTAILCTLVYLSQNKLIYGVEKSESKNLCFQHTLAVTAERKIQFSPSG
jgi:hypothetical protein